jgi:hypothetical protein
MLPATLAAITNSEREDMRRTGRAVLPFFMYGAGAGLPVGEDATPLIAFELWLRKEGRLTEVADMFKKTRQRTSEMR